MFGKYFKQKTFETFLMSLRSLLSMIMSPCWIKILIKKKLTDFWTLVLCIF